MQPHQGSSRIDVAELKSQIVKRIGAERSKRYFYYLNRLLSQKLCNNEFHKLCNRIIGRENLPLHNQFIRSILKNAFTAKTPPHTRDVGPRKSAIENGHRHSGSHFATPIPNAPVRSNGFASPKIRPGNHDRKLRDQHGLIVSNGKPADASHASTATEDMDHKVFTQNEGLAHCDYARSVQHLQGLAQQPENDREFAIHQARERQSMKKSLNSLVSLHSKDQAVLAVFENGGEMEQANRLNFSRIPLIAPLGIPLCFASVGGARKAFPVTSNHYISYSNSGELFDTEVLRTRMEQIAAVQGLEGVTMDCTNLLNNMLDMHLKRLIKSCVDLVEARSAKQTKNYAVQKQHIQSNLLRGMRPCNHLHKQKSGGPTEPCCSISLLDFKAAMELNPLQLGEDWPVLLEKIYMHTFEVEE